MLDEMSIDVARGEALVIVGGSGVGKERHAEAHHRI